jgi:tRNA (uracil-5-)-methyltransferase
VDVQWLPNANLALIFERIVLPQSSVPPIESTVESLLVYAYRTKITPHFERPPKYATKEDAKDGEQPSWLRIGFNVTNSNATLDIEVRCLSF